MCDINGNHLGPSEQHLGRELYFDTLTGTHYLLVSPEEADAMRAGGEDIYQNFGDFNAWMIEPPDYTSIGIMGDKEPAEQKIERPKPVVIPHIKSAARKAATKRKAK